MTIEATQYELPDLDAQRAELAAQRLESPRSWRILHLGAAANGATDIVASLRRALTNLGHTVLHVDTKRTARTLRDGHIDFASGARGGWGPIYVRLASLELILERFRPQIIICNAGGLTFRPEDATELKRRGILLLGITLSDPDVFPSIAPGALAFDYHTTNARNAVPMYAEAGVRNTSWFPFGIDREYVLADVPDAPELQAEVICLGHAVGRPERNRTMREIAERHEVRVYGTGWELPGAEVVRDERQMQAARNGRIHINFAKTRADYINVKCGVFEAIGSGGVVCTARFEEMRHFFEYDREIVGFEDTEDLLVTLGEILGDPTRLEGIRRAAFRRLIGEHLYEHRWLELFDRIERDLAAGGEIVGAERASILTETLSADGAPPRRVVISGFYGARNIGDDLLLRAISEGIREHAGVPVDVTVAAHNPVHVQEAGLPAFARRDLDRATAEMTASSALVLGGGGLWHDRTFERAGGLPGWFREPDMSVTGLGVLPLMAKVLERPFHVFGMGVGPLEDPVARATVRFLAEQADSITVRDTGSAALLSEISGGRLAVETIPDPVYGLRLEEHEAPEAVRRLCAGWRLVAVNLRPWTQAAMDLGSVADALRQIAQSDDVAFVGIPMQAGDRVDAAAIRTVFEAVGNVAPTIMLEPGSPVPDVLGALASCEALLSMRLHACLLSHRLGVPAVGLAYDPKVAGHFEELGIGHRCLPLTAGPDELRGAVEDVLRLGGFLDHETRERVAARSRRAQEALAALGRRIAGAPPMPLPEDGRDWLAPVPADLATPR